MNKIAIKKWNELKDRTPTHALVADVDLVIVRYDDSVTVLYGRCAHRGALMADGHVSGDNLICGLHGWDYRLETGVSEYNNSETLPKFKAWLEDGQVYVDADEIAAWSARHPQPYHRESYQGNYQDPTGTADEPYVKFIRKLAGEGLTKVGHHGPSAAMGVPRGSLPKWDDLQFVVGQLHKLPLLDDEAVGHGSRHWAAGEQTLASGDSVVRFGHEFWRTFRGSESCPRKGSRTGRNRYLFRRGRHAAGRTSRQLALFLRACVGPLRIFLGQGAKMPGISFQGRARRENGHRGPFTRRQSAGQDCTGS